ncbi:amino acid permease [Klebsiella variicola subsp. variicola]|nr:amino acid permease [Klebsiella variicola subsp. variicola]
MPQNMAAVASPSALLIGWAITGVGILFLAFAMLLLTRIRPDLDGGIFTYAREGFGELIGFCSAWGYWLCAVIANVSYLVIVFSALSFFTDTPELRLFGDGNTWQSIAGASVLLWVVHFLVLRGVQTAAGLTWWPPSPNSCRWARLSRSPPWPSSWIRSASISADWRWVSPCGSRLKTPC